MKLFSILLLTLSTTIFAAGPAPTTLSSFIPLILLIVVFYFLLIRPQSKKAKEHKALLSQLKKGDEIVTSGGILGKVVTVDDSFVSVEIAKEVIIKLQKPAVTQKLPKGSV
jgi:preprotein translocase subunit YajC